MKRKYYSVRQYKRSKVDLENLNNVVDVLAQARKLYDIAADKKINTFYSCNYEEDANFTGAAEDRPWYLWVNQGYHQNEKIEAAEVIYAERSDYLWRKMCAMESHYERILLGFNDDDDYFGDDEEDEDDE